MPARDEYPSYPRGESYPRVSATSYEYTDGGRERTSREITPPPPPPPSYQGVVRDVPIPEGIDIRKRRRVSRAQRDKYIAHLRTCYETDMMNEVEFTRRMELAAAAVTEADLQILVDHDLPPFPEPEVPEKSLREQAREAMARMMKSPEKFFRELWVQCVGIVLSFMGAVALAVIPATALLGHHHHDPLAEGVGVFCIVAGVFWFIATVIWTAITIENA
jgi:hypothetical protein